MFSFNDCINYDNYIVLQYIASLAL